MMRKLSLGEMALRKRLIIFLGILLIAGLGLHHFLPFRIFGLRNFRIVELLLIASMLYILIGYKPLFNSFNAISLSFKIYFMCFLAVVLIGHLVKISHYTYPFVAWKMYGYVQNGDPQWYEYIGKLQNGDSVRFIPHQEIPTLKSGRITIKLEKQIQAIQAAKDKAHHTTLMNKHAATLEALVRLYNSQRSGNPIFAITVLQCTLPLNANQVDASIKREFLWEISLSPPQ